MTEKASAADEQARADDDRTQAACFQQRKCVVITAIIFCIIGVGVAIAMPALVWKYFKFDGSNAIL
jgi:hypothetical protein